MSRFKTLFGINQNEVRPTCILIPFASRDIISCLGVAQVERGKLYAHAKTDDFSLITTGMDPGLCGDAVLHLADTPAKNLILFGSCGLTKKMDNIGIGSLVSPHSVYSLESFTEMLHETTEMKTYHPDKHLFENLSLKYQKTIKKVCCATVGSLKLEDKYTDTFEKYDIQAVDMEASAFFSSAKHVGKSAIALFYVTDIVKEKPFYRDPDQSDKQLIATSITKACSILCQFAKTQSA